MRAPRLKFLERGLGIRDKAHNVRKLVDTRRLDGTKTRITDRALGKISTFMAWFFESPVKPKGNNYHVGKYTLATINEERRKLGKPPL